MPLQLHTTDRLGWCMTNLGVTAVWSDKPETWQLDKRSLLALNNLISSALLCSLAPFWRRTVKHPSYLVGALLLLKGIFNIPSILPNYIFSLKNCLTIKCREVKFIIVIPSNINKHINKCLLRSFKAPVTSTRYRLSPALPSREKSPWTWIGKFGLCRCYRCKLRMTRKYLSPYRIKDNLVQKVSALPALTRLVK